MVAQSDWLPMTMATDGFKGMAGPRKAGRVAEKARCLKVFRR